MIDRLRYMEIGCLIGAVAAWLAASLIEWDLLSRFQSAMFSLVNGAWPILLLAALIATIVERAVVELTADRN